MSNDRAGSGIAPAQLPPTGGNFSIRSIFIVAIPVRDEEDCLPACLRALALQQDLFGHPFPREQIRVVLFANNCSDQSASLARKIGGDLSLNLRVFEARLPPVTAHAGAARRAAMDLAEAWLAEQSCHDGVILTTDADSRVAPNWIAENLAAFEAGADAVLGRIELDEDGKLLPDALHRRGELEDIYERLLTELSWLLDPLEHNPWPHHATISGASLAVRRSVYCRVGGMPCVPLGEDKALVALLLRHDAKIRYSLAVHVITSGRTFGRAPGGVADTLAARSREPNALCDEALEPFQTALARAAWRGRLRRLRSAGLLGVDQDWPSSLEISAKDVKAVFRASTFGAAWALIQSGSPLFPRRLIRPAELPEQIMIAIRWLDHLRRIRSRMEERQMKLAVSICALDGEN
jgi:Glycosyl transferase family 2